MYEWPLAVPKGIGYESWKLSVIKWSGKLESLAERVEALERLNVLRGLAKPATKQARAINLICDNLAVIQEMIEKDGTNPTGLIRLADGDA